MHISQLQGGELAHHVLKQGLRMGVCGIVGGRNRGDANAHLVGTNLVANTLHHFHHQAGTVFDAAAVRVGTQVGAGAQKLVDQVAVGGMHFHAIKTRCNGVARGAAVVGHDARQFGKVEGARRGGVHKACYAVLDQHGFCFGCNGRRRNRGLAFGLQVHMRDAPYMPELHDDFAASGMYRCSDRLPGLHLFFAPDAGHVGVALSLVTDGGGFGNDQSCPILGVGALGVVGGHQGRGHGTGCAVAGERGHDNAVGNGDGAELGGIKQSSHAVKGHRPGCVRLETALSAANVAECKLGSAQQRTHR